jgi:hypothetical protein
MPSVPTLSCIPRTFEAGTTLVFLASNSDCPSDEWTLAVILNNGVDVVTAPATASTGDDGFTVTIAAAASGELAGRYAWTEIYTNIATATIKAAGRKGSIDFLPNPAITPTPTFAQAQVTLLKAALASLAGSTRQSVSFNGQSFTRSNLADYQKQLVYWESRVIKENRDAAHLRGETTGGAIGVTFARQDNYYDGFYRR